MTKKTIICVKWGTKYSSHFVNVLRNMTKRNSITDHNFVCLTDDPRGLSADIIFKPLPSLPLEGWWFKPCVFNRDLGLTGDVLYLDLDLVICNNIDKLWTHWKDEFVIIRDFTRMQMPDWTKFNSSVFRFVAEDYYYLGDAFKLNHSAIIRNYRGDQDYLYAELKNKGKFWPDDWIRSYKWEMRDRSELTSVNGRRNFANKANPRVEKNCCIAAFHGDPKPDICIDPWIVERWK